MRKKVFDVSRPKLLELSFSSLSMVNNKLNCKQKHLPWLLSSLLCGSLLLSGCSNGGSDGGSSDTLNADITSNVPTNVVAGNEAILDAEVNVNGGQAANAALFTLGADASDALATITAINYPSVSGVDFTQIIPNGTELPDCTVGLSLSNAAPSCMLKVSIEGQSGQTVDDDIEVVTDVQTLDVAIQTSFVNTGSTALPQGQVSNQITVAPDSTVQIKVSNAQSNTASFNNLHVTIPSWLAEIATNLVGGTVTTNEENDTTTITYTIEGANVDLAPGSTHTFSFALDGSQDTVDTLLAHYDALIDNSDNETLVIDAANLRNPLTPDLTVSLTPMSMTDDVTLSDPDDPQTITVQNLSNSQLQVTEINTDNLPAGVTVVEGASTTCSTTAGDYIEPKDDAGDSCTVQLTVAVDAVPEENKTLSIDYKDPQNNTFEDSTDVNIGGAEISIDDFNSIELPVNGDETTDVTITNSGTLNWTPSNLAANYEITQENESTPADNISVTNGSGTNCLSGDVVEPEDSCHIGITVNANDTATGNYVLSVLPANNLETTKTTNFTITEPTMGSFQFQDNEGDDITTQSFEIGDGAITIQVANEGAIAITSFDLSIPPKFTQDANTCNGNTTLDPEETCTVRLSVDNGAGIGLGAYDIEATGDAATVDNSGQTLEATVQGAVVTFPDEISIPLPSGEDPTEAVITITNNGTNTIAWQPSDDLNNYSIEDNPAGISVVSTNDASACEAIGEVAIDASCTIAIEVVDTAVEDTYTLTLALTDNLAAAQSQPFNITGPLGMFSFSPASITIGTDSTSQPQEITLSNMGDMDITNVYLDLTALPMGFIVSQNTCGTSDNKLATLASDDSCTFEIAASNEVGQGNTVIMAAKGDEDTVENDEAEFETTVSGVVVEIQTINGGDPINRPAEGTQTINVELTNLGNVNWIPSDLNGDYGIFMDTPPPPGPGGGMNIVAPTDDEINCLAGADVTPGNSCYVGIEAFVNTRIGNYNLVLFNAPLSNMPQPSFQLFSVSNSLGYFVYKNEDGAQINDLTLTIGADPVTITLENIGESGIEGVTIATTDETVVSIENNNCQNQELNANDTCTFDLAADSSGIADITTTSDDASNSPATLSVTAEAADPLACDDGTITVGDYEWAPNANLGVAANAAGVAGVTAGGSMDWDTATGGFIDWLNSENYCGYNDWEIPSLAQYGCSAASAGTCDQSVANGLLSSGWNGTDSPVDYLTGLDFDFTNVPLPFDIYWSGTEDDPWAWVLFMSNGFIDRGVKGNFSLVLPVRSNSI